MEVLIFFFFFGQDSPVIHKSWAFLRLEITSMLVQIQYILIVSHLYLIASLHELPSCLSFVCYSSEIVNQCDF